MSNSTGKLSLSRLPRWSRMYAVVDGRAGAAVLVTHELVQRCFLSGPDPRTKQPADDHDAEQPEATKRHTSVFRRVQQHSVMWSMHRMFGIMFCLPNCWQKTVLRSCFIALLRHYSIG